MPLEGRASASGSCDCGPVSSATETVDDDPAVTTGLFEVA